MGRGFKETLVSYFVTAYALFGAFLLVAVFAWPLNDLDIFLLILLFLTAPVAALLGGVFVGAAQIGSGNFGIGLLCLALSAGTYWLWRSVWYAIYGRKRKPGQNVGATH